MSTNAATSFDAITQIIARIERAAGAIGKAAVQMADADGTVRAQLEVPIGGLQPGQGHPLIVQQPFEHDGSVVTLRYELDTSILDEFEMVDVTAEIREVNIEDGAPVLTVGLTIDPYIQPVPTVESDPVDAALDAVRTHSLRPYDDIPYLQELYDRCDTFEEMSERIDMDVSGETVRRYMMQAGIHEPARVQERSDAVEIPETELPSGVDPGQFVTAVADCRTVYEVASRLGLDQQRCRELLTDLGVLDLVLCRMATAEAKEVDRSVVCERLRSTPSGGRA